MTGAGDTDQTGNITIISPSGESSGTWERLKSSASQEAFAAVWLDIQCQLIEDVTQGVVVLGAPEQGPFSPAAVWPEGSIGGSGLIGVIESAITKRRPAVGTEKWAGKSQRPKQDAVACPLIIDAQVCGAVGIEISHRTDKEQQQVIEQLEWGSGWLESLIRRRKITATDRLVTVLELVATSLHYDRLQAAATAVVTELAGHLNCERVSIGFVKKNHAQLKGLSHSASFGEKANIIRAIEAAMDEAIEQQSVIVTPPRQNAPVQVIKAHETLGKEHGTGSICTVPFSVGDKTIGALILERPEGEHFDSATVQLCEHAASLLGPVLEVKRRDDRWLIQKGMDHLRTHVQHLLGPRHTGKKLGVIATVLVVLFFTFAKGDYRVTGNAILEGTVQRAVAAPLSGYIAHAGVRAGDIVKAGDVMFAMDDRDLRLERLKWISQRSQRRSEYSEASAQHDRAKTRILATQIEQAEAQIALIEEQLNRLNVAAPLDGFVVAGDLSQSLGAPVERGDIMFEVAPLHDYRVILQVDERDIGEITEGQTGQLALTGMPGDILEIKVKKLTPISSAEEGSNFFRVEAQLEEETITMLRPGMEGVGKIFVEERKLIWIWTHKIVHWMRMFFWSWWP
ncbi:efflux RND transporter periplasmic adaptor subunit [Solemya velesiana gill symbiont]|uniref:GAF domain-containing protein n=1 Tax=Solemya velesiana gill symbiont TaxID=1918948 RepID=A0A1T2KXU4_9GAMM|nr:efflux RND transporter periplasmic adaptor subunit [Solemya velesiana gill symbiont]OOZ37687.1 hypothetical protein BOW51_01135 [Solemya velesiana gill symbiont]